MEKNTIFSLNHASINAHFSKNHKDFIVRERSLYDFSGEGEHAIIYIQKKDLSTSEAIRILSSHSGLKQRDFSYAGLKDKQALSFQHISFLYKYKDSLKDFSHDKLKIIKLQRHNNKLRIGHLKGNSFFIRLKKVSKIDAIKLKSAFKILCKQGFANYFGYQRFGKDQNNFLSGEELLKAKLEGKRGKNKRLDDFLISAYQSLLFNEYLSERLRLSHFFESFSKADFSKLYPEFAYEDFKAQEQFFKLIRGEVLGHFPFGKCFTCEHIKAESQRFLLKDITPMGLLLGKNAFNSSLEAKAFETKIFEKALIYSALIKGSRRPLISFIKENKCEYIEEKAQFILEFFLEKGSYATVVLEELLHTKL